MTIELVILVSPDAKPVNPPLVIDCNLIQLLLAINDTKSMSEACKICNCSSRQAQRLLKQFKDTDGYQLTERHGQRGTDLSNVGYQCISFYMTARSALQQTLQSHHFMDRAPFRNPGDAKEI